MPRHRDPSPPRAFSPFATAVIAVGCFVAGAVAFSVAGGDESAVILAACLAVASVAALAAVLAAGRRRPAASAEEERLKLALEGAEDGIWDWDLETDEMTFNERWAAMLGYEAGEIELSWESWIDLVHPQDAGGVKKALEAHLGGKIPVYQTEHRIRDRAGRWRWIQARGKVVQRGELGQPLRVSGTHKDITEHKRARRALLRSEALIRTILETAPDGVVTLSSRGRIESFNAAAEHIFGYSAAEILGQSISRLIPDGKRPGGFPQRLAGAASLAGRRQELVGRRRDGTTFPIELSVGEVRLRDHRLFTGLVRDITPRKEAEENLKLFRAMVENMSEGVQLARIRDEVIVYANPALEQMCAYQPGELMGERVSKIYAAAETGTEEFLRRVNDHLARQGSWRGEVRARRKDGAIFWCGIRISTFDHPKLGRLWVSVHEDITHRIGAEEERYRLAGQPRPAPGVESSEPPAGDAAREPDDPSRPEGEAAEVRSGASGTVILADDDDVVRNVARRILEDAGYTVLPAANGGEAVRIFAERRGAVDLVILDLIMPVMGGLACRGRILEIRPDACILLASGYSAAATHQGPGGVEIPLIAKPFDRRTLLRKVRDVLAGREAVVRVYTGAPGTVAADRPLNTIGGRVRDLVSPVPNDLEDS